MAGAVDSSYWTIRPAFGCAGGPLEHALTNAGILRARQVVMQVDKAGVDVLCALARGEQAIETAVGSRMRLTDFGRIAGPSATFPLVERGLIEAVHGRCRAFRLTDAGRRLVALAESEVKSLLDRVKANHPI